MKEKKEKKRKKSIVRKNIFRISFLGLVILVGAVIAAGIVFYQSMTETYRMLAYSLSEMTSFRLSNDKTEKIINDPHALDRMDEYSSDYESFPDGEEKDLIEFWLELNLFLVEEVQTGESMESIQVVVPEEHNVRQLWGVSKDDSIVEPYGKYRPYWEVEKELLGQMWDGDLDGWIEFMSDYSEETIVYPEGDKLIACAFYPVFQKSEEGVMAVVEVEVSITDMVSSIFKLTLYISAITLVIVILAVFLYFRRLKRELLHPILCMQQASADAVEKLREGEQVFQLDIHTRDELEDLSHSFEEMEGSLRSYIDENASITAERERLTTELNLAATIQADMLPDVFPAFPDRTDFDIYASMDPARLVGGDFYDYFLVDEETLAMVIADVSGKGVPASLFMMRSMLLIENITKRNPNPAEVLHEVNQQLCLNNKGGMFVTVWLGLLNLKTGHLRAANAGHEYPIIKKPGGAYELYKDTHSFVLGGSKKMKYKEYDLDIEPGSVLFLYTDGATEAKNPENEMVRTEGLIDIVNRTSDESPETKLKEVEQEIRAFIRDSEQFDDLTMMCVFYFGDR